MRVANIDIKVSRKGAKTQWVIPDGECNMNKTIPQNFQFKIAWTNPA